VQSDPFHDLNYFIDVRQFSLAAAAFPALQPVLLVDVPKASTFAPSWIQKIPARAEPNPHLEIFCE
jgi:hypothetical protein